MNSYASIDFDMNRCMLSLVCFVKHSKPSWQSSNKTTLTLQATREQKFDANASVLLFSILQSPINKAFREAGELLFPKLKRVYWLRLYRF